VCLCVCVRVFVNACVCVCVWGGGYVLQEVCAPCALRIHTLSLAVSQEISAYATAALFALRCTFSSYSEQHFNI